MHNFQESLSLPIYLAALVLATLGYSSSYANEAAVIDVQASCDSARVCSFDVTVKHADTGWDHYANHWRVLSVDGATPGKELGKRVLHHPHETEQPFTRSLSGVKIPDDVTEVEVQAHDSVHEYGGPKFTLPIP